MLGINGALKAVGYGLLMLFFAAGVVKTCGSLTELKRPEAAVRLFVRFVLAKAAVGYGLDLIMAIFSVAQGTISTVTAAGGLTSGAVLPSEIVDKINAVSFWDSIPLWAVTLLGSLFITVLSFLMILTVYGRMFKLFLYAAIAPIPLATFAGELSNSVGKISALVCRRLSRGAGDCAVLRDFLSHGLQPSRGRSKRFRRDGGLDVCGGADLQFSCSCRFHQNERPGGEGADGAVIGNKQAMIEAVASFQQVWYNNHRIM